MFGLLWIWYPADPEYPVNPVHDVFQRKMSFLPFPNGMEFRETGVFVCYRAMEDIDR